MSKKLLALIIASIMIFMLTACGGGSEEAESKEPEVVKYKLNIEVECESNILLDKYDVVVLVNDNKLGVLEHGATETFSAELEAGDYTVEFKEDGGDASGSIGVSISGDTDLKYKISCKSDEIVIDEVILSDTLVGQKKDDVIKQLKDAGFTNIKENPDYDIYFDKDAIGDVEAVSIDGNKEFRSFDDFEKDAKVYVKYHEYYEKDPELAKDDSSEKTTDTSEKKEGKKKGNKILTIENSSALKNLLTSDDEADFAAFAEKYAGKTIEFDGSIDYLANHNNYKTRYDFLISYGDYSEDTQDGPTFKLENYSVSQKEFPDESYAVGDPIHIVAKVDEFKSGVFYLTPIKVKHR